jgi:two-component system, cell cycle response regulator CtrA
MTAGCPLCGNPLPPDRVLVDVEGGLIVGNGHVAALARQEFALFEALWEARPRTLTKEQLLKALYGLLPEADMAEIKIIDVFVCKARKKLAATGIEIGTVWGRGYRMVPASEAAEASADVGQFISEATA